MTLYCATSNPGKLREFQLAIHVLGQGWFTVAPLPGLAAITPPDETGSTFEENAIQKALAYASHTDGWLFVDDSGLEVAALNGAPGIHSARFAGLQATDADNRHLLLQRMQGQEDRRARFVCVVALVRAGQLVHTFRGETAGQLLVQEIGAGGFGYDSLFYCPSAQATFAEISEEDKLHISHRGIALQGMIDYLKQMPAEKVMESRSG